MNIRSKCKVLIVVVIISISCEKIPVNFDDINFSNKELEFDICIDGFISTEKTRYVITVSKPVRISKDIIYTPINDARVYISVDDQIFDFEIMNENGKYITKDSICAIPGKTYTLIVEHDEKQYSASDSCPNYTIDYLAPVFFETFKYDDNFNIIPNDDGVVRVNRSKHNFGFEKSYLMIVDQYKHRYFYDSITWDLVHIKNFIDKQVYIHSNSLPQGVFSSFIYGSGLSGESEDSLLIINLSISQRYHDYLISRFSLTDWQTGIFSTIPGNTKTNFSQGATGFFYVVNSKRMFIQYKDLLK
jgi:hypothetical protein